MTSKNGRIEGIQDPIFWYKIPLRMSRNEIAKKRLFIPQRTRMYHENKSSKQKRESKQRAIKFDLLANTVVLLALVSLVKHRETTKTNRTWNRGEHRPQRGPPFLGFPSRLPGRKSWGGCAQQTSYERSDDLGFWSSFSTRIRPCANAAERVAG